MDLVEGIPTWCNQLLLPKCGPWLIGAATLQRKHEHGRGQNTLFWHPQEWLWPRVFAWCLLISRPHKIFAFTVWATPSVDQWQLLRLREGKAGLGWACEIGWRLWVLPETANALPESCQCCILFLSFPVLLHLPHLHASLLLWCPSANLFEDSTDKGNHPVLHQHNGLHLRYVHHQRHLL